MAARVMNDRSAGEAYTVSAVCAWSRRASKNTGYVRKGDIGGSNVLGGAFVAGLFSPWASRRDEVADGEYFFRVSSYRQLDESQIAQTLDALRARITERFPDSQLRKVSEQLIDASREVFAVTAYLRRPNWVLRGLGGVATLGLVVLLLAVARVTLSASGQMGMSDIVQTVEAAVNDIVFFGIAVYFLLTIETRVKRGRALRVLHELRSLAHIVDMHQLTKDPERLSSSPADAGVGGKSRRTAGKDLGRYLDYCSELLSLTSKIAAVLVQNFNDRVVLAGVNEIEELTTGLSGKIWQKITILERARSR